MKSRSLFCRPMVAVTAAALLLFWAFPRHAAAQDDPPSRVAQLNMAQGSVSFQPAGEKDWVAADFNRPLTTGDSLWADQDSRGELHIGSTSLRISSQTGLTFLNLNDRTVQIQLAQGSLEVTLRQLDSGDAYEIDTPNIAFSLLQPGTYRVDVDPEGQTTAISVFDGQGQVTGGGSSYNLNPGQRGSFTGTDTLSYDVSNLGANDDFDNWCHSRDDAEDQSQSANYVSTDVTGYEDLDANGTWENVPDYGEVWVPNDVPAGWAPYHYGHWVWIEPWGWTWVEDEPWGFAPFHYGRWAFVTGGWAWVPGPRVMHPVYAPALVVFVGAGANVAWFPLGPREVYIPAYHASPRYIQYINVTNTRVTNAEVTNAYNNDSRGVNATRINYVNENVHGSVTAVSHDTFVNARPVARAAVQVNSEQLRGSAVLAAPPVTPQRQSLVAADARPAAHPPASVTSRPVVARLAPPPSAVPFDRRQPALATQPGRPLAPEKLDQMRQPGEEYQHPTVKYTPPARAASSPRSQSSKPSPPPKSGRPH
ncbi:MAG: DUF6600 domain-containing protein [Candidatus Acidiferrales bacterium]